MLRLHLAGAEFATCCMFVLAQEQALAARFYSLVKEDEVSVLSSFGSLAAPQCRPADRVLIVLPSPAMSAWKRHWQLDGQ